MKTKIAIIEDNLDLRDAYTFFISKQSNLEVVSTHDNVEDFLVLIKEDISKTPDILLLDIKLKGMNGIKGCGLINDFKPDIKIIMISVHEDADHVFQALKLGATGYLTKNINQEKLLNAINECMQGGAPMSSKIAQMVVQSFHVKKVHLNHKESMILNLLAEGKSYQSIGDEMFLSKDTIKYHIKHIYKKLQATNKMEAIHNANKMGLI